MCIQGAPKFSSMMRARRNANETMHNKKDKK